VTPNRRLRQACLSTRNWHGRCLARTVAGACAERLRAELQNWSTGEAACWSQRFDALREDVTVMCAHATHAQLHGGPALADAGDHKHGLSCMDESLAGRDDESEVSGFLQIGCNTPATVQQQTATRLVDQLCRNTGDVILVEPWQANVALAGLSEEATLSGEQSNHGHVFAMHDGLSPEEKPHATNEQTGVPRAAWGEQLCQAGKEALVEVARQAPPCSSGELVCDVSKTERQGTVAASRKKPESAKGQQPHSHCRPEVAAETSDIIIQGQHQPLATASCSGMQVWKVVGGLSSGGLLVRTGQATSSTKKPNRLLKGSLVKQLVLHGDRLCYELVSGAGPSTGWVSTTFGGKKLLMRCSSPEDEVVQSAHPVEEGHGCMATSSASTAKGHCSADGCGEGKGAAADNRCPMKLLLRHEIGNHHLALFHDEASASRQEIQKVCVLGPLHSCTNAIARELGRFFQVRVVNEDHVYRASPWKHQVLRSRLQIPKDMLCICLVKDPAFWIQSLGRNPREGTFYEIHPVRPLGGSSMELVEPLHAGQLFHPVFFDDCMYSDALEIWEATVRGYFNQHYLPLARTVVLRCEDFLFSFPVAMQALAACGLPLRADAPSSWNPLPETAKDDSHPSCTRRGRTELLRYYSDRTMRYKGFTERQVQRLQCVDPELIQLLGYGKDAVQTWLQHDEKTIPRSGDS